MIMKERFHMSKLDLKSVIWFYEEISLFICRDFRFLFDVPRLETLILDRNNLDSHVKFPTLTELTTLSVNHNAIGNLSKLSTEYLPQINSISIDHIVHYSI